MASRPPPEARHFDAIVIGSGAAGLTAALNLAAHGRVAVLAKGGLADGSTAWAQGGIAAVLDAGDTVAAHVDDTMVAGAGLNHRATVEYVASNASAAIDRLAALGVPFNPGETVSERWHLTREGGHSHRRIVHVDDATGWAVSQALIKAAAAHPNITLVPGMAAVDLITHRHVLGERFPARRCHGVYALDVERRHVVRFVAPATVLATGGASRVYLYSTNPDGATGDGIAMAWRAGCRVSNMEFNQFHPTCLYHPKVRNFLITEAARGEGGHLKLPDGSRFMARYDERMELAPRDVVARAIDAEMKRSGEKCVYLDITHKPAEFITSRFPTIYETCLKAGLDITKSPIPVVPAAHYQCGGVKTDLNGETSIRGLFAIGEVACTGLHGANRLASNSLLEGLVTAHRAFEKSTRKNHERVDIPLPEWRSGEVQDVDELVVISHNWEEVRRLMWDYVGIVRTDKRLQRAATRLRNLHAEVQEFYWNFKVTTDLLELRNLVTVASLVVDSALSRKESRGLHFTLDYPERDDRRFLRDTLLRRT